MLKNNINGRTQKGFSLIEMIIAITLLIGMMAVLMTMVVGGVQSAKSGQHIADLKTLASQKNSQITSNLTNELKKFSVGQTLIGSINPSETITGYFDFLNDSGCIVQKATSTIEPPIKVNPTETPKEQKTGRDGGLGDTGEGTPTQNTIDCSKSTFGSPTSSTIPRYRRQWVIAKDKPFFGDVTIGVIIVDLQINEIVRSEIFTKVDGK